MKTSLYYFPQVASTVLFAVLLTACDSGSDTIVDVVETQGNSGETGTIQDETAVVADDTAEVDETAQVDDIAEVDETEIADDGENSEQTDSGTTDNDELQTDTTDVEFEATFRATFDATWSAETHPTNFPANPHFSPLTGAVHSAQTILWQPGDLASPGIEMMAASGGTGTLLSEIEFAISEGRALVAIEGAGIETSPGTTTVEFTVNRDNSQVTLVSMMAPSPDWFIGVHGFELIENGDFINSVTIGLALYDAGTDSGLQYESPDQDSEQRSPVTLTNSFPTDSDFFDGDPLAGTLTIERIQ